LQGEHYAPVAQALRDGDLESAPVTQAERLLLQFVGTLTKHAYRITDEQVQGLRDAGWTDAQIAEAVYDGALFNLFVRLADAFDIHPPAMLDSAGIPAALTRDG
jgi:alkylhydroperoxidase family enzyme